MLSGIWQADFPEEAHAILSRNPNIPERRIDTITREVAKKIDVLGRIAK